MGLLSFLKRSPSAGAGAPSVAAAPVLGDEPAERARTRARHRLIGAVVLLGMAVVGFPLLFETEPRPIPMDLPIVIPKKDAVPPLAMARPGGEAPDVITESAEEAARGVDVPEPIAPAVPKPAPKAELRSAAPKPEPKPVPRAEAKPEPRPEPKPLPKPESRPEAKPVPKPETKPEPKPEPRPEPKPVPRTEARAEAKPEPRAPTREEARAQALLEGRQPEAVRVETARAPEAGGRFALQIGAFSEGGSARDARQKVERLGLRSYTQEIETAEGRRIRVRVGPFASRAEADQAAAKLRAAGLPAAMLSQ